MSEMLIKMVDGGLVNYTDDHESYGGCPTCDYGSQYINDINITLTHHRIHVRTNQMYEYVLSEGQMIRLFLSYYDAIRTMTEKEFINWFKSQLLDMTQDDFREGSCIEAFDVTVIE